MASWERSERNPESGRQSVNVSKALNARQCVRAFSYRSSRRPLGEPATLIDLR